MTPEKGASGMIQIILGEFCLFIGVVAFPYYLILASKYQQRYGSITTTALGFASGIFVIFPLCFIEYLFFIPEGSPKYTLTRLVIAEVFYVIVFGTTIAYTLVVWASNYLSPSIMIGFNVLQPIASLITGLILRSMTPVPHFGIEGLQFGQLGLLASIIGLGFLVLND
eukprot:UN14508